MRQGIILTLTRWDTLTEYLSAFSYSIELEAEDKGINIKPLNEKDANKEEFEKVLNELDYNMIVFNGHGSEDSIEGDKGKVLIKVGENDHILQNRIVYARSCKAAAILGEKCTENSGGCFIGYLWPFEFYFNEKWAANPIKDNIASMFIEPANLIPTTIIKGN